MSMESVAALFGFAGLVVGLLIGGFNRTAKGTTYTMEELREYGRQRYQQGLNDAHTAAGYFVYLDDAPVMTAEQYGALLDEEEVAR